MPAAVTSARYLPFDPIEEERNKMSHYHAALTNPSEPADQKPQESNLCQQQ
jgi:hypothetical protein